MSLSGNHRISKEGNTGGVTPKAGCHNTHRFFTALKITTRKLLSKNSIVLSN